MFGSRAWLAGEDCPFAPMFPLLIPLTLLSFQGALCACAWTPTLDHAPSSFALFCKLPETGERPQGGSSQELVWC